MEIDIGVDQEPLRIHYKATQCCIGDASRKFNVLENIKKDTTPGKERRCRNGCCKTEDLVLLFHTLDHMQEKTPIMEDVATQGRLRLSRLSRRTRQVAHIMTVKDGDRLKSETESVGWRVKIPPTKPTNIMKLDGRKGYQLQNAFYQYDNMLNNLAGQN